MRQIKKVGVVGAGTMGSAIAQHFLMKGLTVTLMDMNEAAVERGAGLIKKSFEEAKSRNLLKDEDVARFLSALTCTTNLSNLALCGFIVEAVFEDLDVKQKLFRELERTVPNNTILASNTSSFLIAELAEGLQTPERVIGVHYFYHAAKNKLVEIIPGPKTAKELVTQCRDFYAYYDKIPIVVKDAPGFAVNRFFVPWLNEAVRLYEEGLGTIPFIDEVARNTFKIGMGPFALMNATGVPIAEHAAAGLAKTLGAFYSPSAALKEQVASGKPWNLEETSFYCGAKAPSNDEKTVSERLLAASLGVARKLVEEGVTDATSVDLGARVGLRWPRGPFEMINRLEKANIPLQVVDSFTSGRAGFIIFNAPDRMNPLSPESVSQLATAFDSLEKNQSLEAIYFLGRGKAFVAGADVKFFVNSIQQNDFDRIVQFTRFGQELLSRISASSKKTVAYLNGLTLGGGLELALSCRYRIGTPKTMLAFPETGIGIYPGLGGTQRAPRLVGEGLAKFLIATGQMVNAKTALRYGLIDVLTEPVFSPEELCQLELRPQSGAQKNLEEEGIASGFAFFDGKLTAELFQNDLFKKYEKVLRRKAPLALQKAMSLVDAGARLPLEKGLELELESLQSIFSTKDALAGLSSLLKREKPEFKGE